MKKKKINGVVTALVLSALLMNSFSSFTNAAEPGSESSPPAAVASEAQETEAVESETLEGESETTVTVIEPQTEQSEVEETEQQTEEEPQSETPKEEESETSNESSKEKPKGDSAEDVKEISQTQDKGIAEYRIAFNNSISGVAFQTLTGSSSSAVNVKPGYNFMFKVVRQHTYNNSRIKVYDTYVVNGNTVREEVVAGATGTYKISNVQADHELSLSCENQITLRMPEADISLVAISCIPEGGEAYDLSMDNIQKDGSLYTFYVPENERVQIKLNPDSKLNGENLQVTEDGNLFQKESLEDGTYQFTKKYGVCGSAEYIVSEPESYSYSVKFPTEPNVDIELVGESKTEGIAKGDSFQFKVTPKEAYTQSTLTVTANGTVINSLDGVYTIENITEDQTLDISGLQKNVYIIYKPNVEGAVVEALPGYDTKQVIYGEEFKFTVKKNAGYSLVNMSVLANGQVITADESGVYTVSNIISNVMLDLKDIEKDMIVTVGKTTLKTGEKTSVKVENVPSGYTVKLHNCTPTNGILKRNGTLQGKKAGSMWITAVATKGKERVTAEIKITVKQNAHNWSRGSFSRNGIYYTVTKQAEEDQVGRVCVSYHPNNSSLAGNITIPTYVKKGGMKYKVTCIGESAFCGARRIQSITIPRSIKLIGVAAFMGCKNLTDFRVDEGNLYYAGDGAMLLNKTRTTLIAYPGAAGRVSINGNITTIAAYAMTGSRAASLTLGRKVSNIQPCAFANSRSLTKVVFMNKNATSVEYGCVFDGVNELCKVYVPEIAYEEYINRLAKGHSSHPFHTVRSM